MKGKKFDAAEKHFRGKIQSLERINKIQAEDIGKLFDRNTEDEVNIKTGE